MMNATSLLGCLGTTFIITCFLLRVSSQLPTTTTTTMMQTSTTPDDELPTAPGNRMCLVRSPPPTCQSLTGRRTAYSYSQINRVLPSVNEEIIEAVTILIRNVSPPPPTACIEFLAHILCIISRPPCNGETSLPMLICDESCRAYRRILKNGTCDVLGERLEELGQISPNRYFPLFVQAYNELDCRDPTTYFFLNITDPDPYKCTNLFTPKTESAILSSCGKYDKLNCTEATEVVVVSPTLLLYILVPTSLFLCVLIFIVILSCSCCCLYRKRKKNKNDSNIIMQDRDDGGLVSELSHSYKRGPGSDDSSYHVTSSNTAAYKKIFMAITIPYKTLTVGDVVGQGAFGKVYGGEYISENGTLQVAIKTLKDLRSDGELEEFFSETMIMKDFHHPNILGLVGVVFDTPNGVPYLVLPYMELGNVKNFLKSKRVKVSNVHTLPKGIQLSTIITMCMNVTMGMEYLAEKMFVHRDLAARNCMINQDMVVKVGDFGLARDVYATDYYRSNNKFAKLPVKWMPPEAFNDKISNEETDVWSYGVTCWEIFSLGRTPYPTLQNSEIFDFISEGRRLDKPTLCPEKIFEYVVNCWEQKPEDRPTFKYLSAALTEYWDDHYAYI